MLGALAATDAVVIDLDRNAVETGEHRFKRFHTDVPGKPGDAAALAAEADGKQSGTVLDAEKEVINPGLADNGHKAGFDRAARVFLRFPDGNLAARRGGTLDG